VRLFGLRLGTFFKIGIIAFVFILLAKWVLTRVKIPALSAAAQAV
jgi:hypothetical protein